MHNFVYTWTIGLTELSTRNPLYQDEDSDDMNVDRMSQVDGEGDLYRDDKSEQIGRTSIFGGSNPAYFGDKNDASIANNSGNNSGKYTLNTTWCSIGPA